MFYEKIICCNNDILEMREFFLSFLDVFFLNAVNLFWDKVFIRKVIYGFIE